jgi:hypothetical protein
MLSIQKYCKVCKTSTKVVQKFADGQLFIQVWCAHFKLNVIHPNQCLVNLYLPVAHTKS